MTSNLIFSEGNYQYLVKAIDKAEPGKGVDTYNITILDKNGIEYHTAAGTLQGGNINIHLK